jgi:hypothetical protein
VDDTAIISVLRNARKADDRLSRLREGSLELRRERIIEALQDPDWAAGPAQLMATYPHHALANRDGTLMRVKIEDQDDGTITLGKVDVYEVSEPIGNVAAEVMEAAKAAVAHILADDIESATPLVAGIANALNFKGDLARQVQTEVAKRSVQRDATWHKTVREALGADARVELPAIREGDLTGTLDDLKSALTTAARTTAASLKRLAEANAPAASTTTARDIAADLKYAIQALTTADRQDESELAGVYEGVANMAGHLLLGAEYLKALANPTQPED